MRTVGVSKSAIETPAIRPYMAKGPHRAATTDIKLTTVAEPPCKLLKNSTGRGEIDNSLNLGSAVTENIQEQLLTSDMAFRERNLESVDYCDVFKSVQNIYCTVGAVICNGNVADGIHQDLLVKLNRHEHVKHENFSLEEDFEMHCTRPERATF